MVIGLWATRIFKGCRMHVLRYALYVRYSLCSRRSYGVVGFGSFSNAVNVSLDKVFVTVVL